MWHTDHGLIRKCALTLQIGYYAVVTILNWANIALLLLSLLLIFGLAITM